MRCRHCEALLEHCVIDLGLQPPSNAYLRAEDFARAETTAPLRAFVCTQCWLMQIPTYHGAAELFTSDYAYFSSVSSSWVEHAKRYMSAMATRFRLGSDSFMVEVASNDGYLLQFAAECGIRALGVEPTASTARAARERGVETLEAFFGAGFAKELAHERGRANLIAANNVLAHVPDINDFVAGFRELLTPDGVATFEFPHLVNLIDFGQFDTIYHEHYSYLSLSAVRHIFESRGLRIFDVEQIPTHGGSLRVFACRSESKAHSEQEGVGRVLSSEAERGVQTLEYYAHMQTRADAARDGLLRFLSEQVAAGKVVAAYGAAAKGNTLLNYAGVKSDLLSFVCDAAESKQGRYLPGSHIPIFAPEILKERRPDFVLILPWNLRAEIEDALGFIRDWGGRFAIAIPELEIL